MLDVTAICGGKSNVTRAGTRKSCCLNRIVFRFARHSWSRREIARKRALPSSVPTSSFRARLSGDNRRAIALIFGCTVDQHMAFGRSKRPCRSRHPPVSTPGQTSASSWRWPQTAIRRARERPWRGPPRLLPHLARQISGLERHQPCSAAQAVRAGAGYERRWTRARRRYRNAARRGIRQALRARLGRRPGAGISGLRHAEDIGELGPFVEAINLKAWLEYWC